MTVLPIVIVVAVLAIAFGIRRHWFQFGTLMVGALLIGMFFFGMTWLTTQSSVHRTPLSERQIDDLRLQLETVARRNAETIPLGAPEAAAPVPPLPPEPVAPAPSFAAAIPDEVVEPSVGGTVPETELELAAERELERELKRTSELEAAAAAAVTSADEVTLGEVATEGEFRSASDSLAVDSSNPSSDPPAEGSDIEPTPGTGTASPASVPRAYSRSAAPDWVSQPPVDVNGRAAVVIISDPFEDRFACDENLERLTRNEIERAAIRRCKQRGLPVDLGIRVSYGEIDAVAKERYYQTRSTSVGDMIQGYQLTVFDDSFQAKLDQRIQEATVDRRLTATGVVSGCTLLALASLFGVFRFASRKDPDPLSA